MEITRQIVLDAERADVWDALIDPKVRSEWLDDERPIEILTARAGHELTWTWGSPDGDGESTVVIQLEQTDDDRTVLTVTERQAAAASCSVGPGAVDVEAWDRRLLGLELRCVLASHADTLVAV